jgi:carboxypeptidase C (cathepsin A)
MGKFIVLIPGLVLSACFFSSGIAQITVNRLVPKSDSTTPEVSVTSHMITVEGKLIHYTATAGTILLRNEKEDSVALMGFTA